MNGPAVIEDLDFPCNIACPVPVSLIRSFLRDTMVGDKLTRVRDVKKTGICFPFEGASAPSSSVLISPLRCGAPAVAQSRSVVAWSATI